MPQIVYTLALKYLYNDYFKAKVYTFGVLEAENGQAAKSEVAE